MHACMPVRVYVYVLHMCVCVCVCVCVYLCTQVCWHEYTCLYIYTHTLLSKTSRFTDTESSTYRGLSASIRNNTATCIIAIMAEVVPGGYIHTNILTYILTYLLSCAHTYIRTYVHTYVHTYIHMCMYAYVYITRESCIPKRSRRSWRYRLPHSSHWVSPNQLGPKPMTQGHWGLMLPVFRAI